jgi:hypothetical protein
VKKGEKKPIKKLQKNGDKSYVSAPIYSIIFIIVVNMEHREMLGGC